ncbi:helix-turn-helix domain-containing protein [Streptomyces sp. CRN 30]|uniref:TetR/AcrR family transcriptional regulator n=1 Tax=Streptomyces sp. CRN 30 TaxID=3075613 RepID=UPI002A7F64E0|nr:helix-turn-helix domain-containing protein [Streptomyces sp. CRN 30]
MTGQRSDARRNYARILEVAAEEVAEQGAEASLERIARVAGVGSATVRRHFPTRQALLGAVFAQRVEALCRRAGELAGRTDAFAALVDWLREVLEYSVAARGLADALTYTPLEDLPAEDSCGSALETASASLLRGARREGTVGDGVTAHDLLVLVVGIALATEHHADPAEQAARSFRLAVEGLRTASR